MKLTFRTVHIIVWLFDWHCRLPQVGQAVLELVCYITAVCDSIHSLFTPRGQFAPSANRTLPIRFLELSFSRVFAPRNVLCAMPIF